MYSQKFLSKCETDSTQGMKQTKPSERFHVLTSLFVYETQHVA